MPRRHKRSTFAPCMAMGDMTAYLADGLSEEIYGKVLTGLSDDDLRRVDSWSMAIAAAAQRERLRRRKEEQEG